MAYERASAAYEKARKGWEEETISTGELCEASLLLFHAKDSVPFSSRARAASEHRDRLKSIKFIVLEGHTIDIDVGTKERARFSKYWAEAERMASDPFGSTP